MRKMSVLMGLIIVLASTLLAVPAQAADVRVYSDSRKSVVWFDDSNNRIVMCDLVNGDGDGASGIGYNNTTNSGSHAVHYNGCREMAYVGDGASYTMRACDWVYDPSLDRRRDSGCSFSHLGVG